MLWVCRYIQRLKDDEGLRLQMGRAGREAVGCRTIEYVVGDLLRWYAQGAHKRSLRSTWSCVMSVLALAGSLPATIFIIFWYDITVNYLLKKFISYSAKTAHH